MTDRNIPREFQPGTILGLVIEVLDRERVRPCTTIVGRNRRRCGEIARMHVYDPKGIIRPQCRCEHHHLCWLGLK